MTVVVVSFIAADDFAVDNDDDDDDDDVDDGDCSSSAVARYSVSDITKNVLAIRNINFQVICACWQYQFLVAKSDGK